MPSPNARWLAKCTQYSLLEAKKSCQKWDLKSCVCILHNIASSFHRHTCQLEFKMPLPPAKKQKTPACVREIQVHKLWTKVYSQNGLTAMWRHFHTTTAKIHKIYNNNSGHFYWVIHVGLLTPLTFARRRSSPLAAFTAGAYFLHNGRRWQRICEFYTANFQGIFWGPES